MQISSVFSYSVNDSPSKHAGFDGILSKAKNGESGAFTDIYNLYFKRIYRFIYFRVSHKETAEDLAEEVFLKAFGKISTINETGAFDGWLYQIARNLVIDHYRSKKGTVALEEIENTFEYESNIVDEVNLQADQKLLLKVLKELPKEQQMVVRLKFFEELSNAEISELLGKSEGAVRVIQHRAILKLQQLLKQ